MKRLLSIAIMITVAIFAMGPAYPRSQMTDSYKIKLPEKQRYFLRLDMGKPYLIDVPSQNVKE